MLAARPGAEIVDRVLADSFSVLTPSQLQTFAALTRKLVGNTDA